MIPLVQLPSMNSAVEGAPPRSRVVVAASTQLGVKATFATTGGEGGDQLASVVIVPSLPPFDTV